MRRWGRVIFKIRMANMNPSPYKSSFQSCLTLAKASRKFQLLILLSQTSMPEPHKHGGSDISAQAATVQRGPRHTKLMQRHLSAGEPIAYAVEIGTAVPISSYV